MVEKFSDFEILEIKELQEDSENQNTKKSTSTWLNVWTSWAENNNFETSLLVYEAKQLDENKQMALHKIIVAEWRPGLKILQIMGVICHP